MRPIKQDAIQNDIRLLEMALYEVTKGQTQFSDQGAIVKKVAEYKRLIKRGTFTLDGLEDKIFSRFGIIDERSKDDTIVYDASNELMKTPLGGIFGQLVQASQRGMTGTTGEVENPEGPLTEREIEELDELDRLAELDRLGRLDEFELNELDELDEDFEQGQANDDFPDTEEPEDDLPF